MNTSDKAHKLLSLAEQWERDAVGCRRDGYIDAAVVKEECAQRIRQTLGIRAIAEVLEVEQRARKLLEAECGRPLPLDIPVCAAISVVKAALSQPAPSAPVEVDYAKRLATSLWQRHYREDVPQWEPLDDLPGLLSQIDNMVSGLTRAPVGVGAPGSHAWMAEVCRAAALSLAAHGVWNDQLSKVADWIAQQSAAVECDCPAGRIDHASWCAVSKAQDAAIAAQPGGSDNDH